MDNTDIEKISTLVPFHEMSATARKELLGKAKIVKYPEGKMVFKRNDEDQTLYWLIEGAVDLLDEKFQAKNRSAEDDAAKFALDNNSPHKLSAVTTTESRVLQISREDLNIGPGTEASADDVDKDEQVDWMSALLSSPLFEFIPPANIQTLFSRFEEVAYESGETVIRQGEPGDYFYVIQSGRARVERAVGDKTAVLAELGAGDNFGQDALVSDVPRNATVTMLTSGTLMRLSEPDFESLLMNPLIERVSMDEAQEMIQQGEPRTYLLDVRSTKELETGKISGAINVPLLSLRKNLGKLKQEAVYVTASGGGKRSELAAYILNENGFTAYVLKEGQDE